VKLVANDSQADREDRDVAVVVVFELVCPLVVKRDGVLCCVA
jgi:hypothetical protein